MSTISALIVNKLLQRNIIVCEKAEICRIGIMLILADMINFSLVLLIGILTKSFFESVAYIIVFWSVRRFSGGFHAKTHLVCRLVTVGTYVLILIASKFINNYYLIIDIICCVFSIITMLLFAPVKHPNKELTDKEIKANKLFAALATLFFATVSLVLTLINKETGLVISLILFAVSILMYIGLQTNKKGVKTNVKYCR